MSKYSIEIINDLDKMESIKKEWNLLASVEQDLNPFLSYEWFNCWFSCFVKEENIHTYVIKEKDEIKAIAPMTVCNTKQFGISVRMLSLAGNDHTHAVKIISDKKDIEGYVDEILKKIIEEGHLHLFIRNINMDDEGIKYILHRLKQKDMPFFWGIRFVRQSLVANIGQGWEEYKKGISKRFRKNLNNKRNRLEKNGALDFKKYTTLDKIESKALPAITKISKNSWQGKDGTGIFSLKETEKFYKTLIKDFSPKSWPVVWVMYLDGRPAAYEFHIVSNKHIYALKAEFDAEFCDYSVGNVLAAYIIEKLSESGDQIYNMSGYYEEYKQSWPGTVERYIRIFAFRKNVIGFILYFLDFPVRNFFKSIKKWCHTP